MATIYIYKPPYVDYYIAKRNPFNFYIPTMDHTGNMFVQVIHGIPILLPPWEWVHTENGVSFAGFRGYIYEITDLVNSVFMAP